MLPKDFQLPVMIVPTSKDAIEMSLSENFFALAMNPADACTAFRSIIEKEKKTPGVAQPTQTGPLVLPTISEDDLDGHLHGGKAQRKP